jgi:FkbM family methyltransferase
MWGAKHLKNLALLATNYHGLRRPIARSYVFDLIGLVTDEMLVDCGNERFYVSTRDRAVGHELFIRRQFDEAAFERTFRLLEERGHRVADRVFLDIGANIGTTSVMAITRLGCAHVFAFEPEAHNVRLLRQNIIVNGVEDRITVVPVAVSDSAGAAPLVLSSFNSGDHRVNATRAVPLADRDVTTVPTVTLDDWLNENEVDLASIGIAWVDVQGHEAHVLAGASQLLDAHVPALCEFWPHGLREAESLDRLCQLVEDRCREVLDLGPPAAARPPTRLAAGELRTLGNRYVGVDGHCDLLLLP